MALLLIGGLAALVSTIALQRYSIVVVDRLIDRANAWRKRVQTESPMPLRPNRKQWAVIWIAYVICALLAMNGVRRNADLPSLIPLVIIGAGLLIWAFNSGGRHAA